MSELIRREDAIKATWKEPSYADPLNVLTEVRDRINALPAASPWHRVEDDAEFLSLIISEICSYSVKNEMEPDDSLRTVAQNILKLLKISTFNNWMSIDPPKEEEHGN